MAIEGLGPVRRLLTMGRRGSAYALAGCAALAIFFQILGWTFQLLAVWTAMRAFDIHAPLPAAGVVLLVMNVVTILPFWPGNIGLVQVAIASALVGYGVSYSVGVAYGFGLQAIEASVGSASGSSSSPAKDCLRDAARDADGEPGRDAGRGVAEARLGAAGGRDCSARRASSSTLTLAPRRASRGRRRTAPRRAPRASAPRRAEPARARAARRSAPARPGPARRSALGLGHSRHLLDARAEAAVGERDVDARSDRDVVAEAATSPDVRPDDRVASLSVCRGDNAASFAAVFSSAARFRSTASAGASRSRSRVVRGGAAPGRRLTRGQARSRSADRARRWRSRSSERRTLRASAARARSSLPNNSSQLRHDELAGGRRSRGADVRCEIAERRVLLVPDGRDDGDRAVGDGSDDALVAEGEEVLEAAAAAGEDDHVDVRVLAERADRGHDLGRRARALHVGLRDEDRCRREARPDRRDDVALRRRVVPGHDADPARQERQRALALVGEETLGREGRLQLLERGEMRAELRSARS